MSDVQSALQRICTRREEIKEELKRLETVTQKIKRLEGEAQEIDDALAVVQGVIKPSQGVETPAAEQVEEEHPQAQPSEEKKVVEEDPISTGLGIAEANREEVLALVGASDSPEQTRTTLEERFGFSRAQADAVLRQYPKKGKPKKTAARGARKRVIEFMAVKAGPTTTDELKAFWAKLHPESDAATVRSTMNSTASELAQDGYLVRLKKEVYALAPYFPDWSGTSCSRFGTSLRRAGMAPRRDIKDGYYVFLQLPDRIEFIGELHKTRTGGRWEASLPNVNRDKMPGSYRSKKIGKAALRRIYLSKYPFQPGTVVAALSTITEGDVQYARPVETDPKNPHFVHATGGDIGLVETVDDNTATVRFLKGTATVVGAAEVEFLYHKEKLAYPFEKGVKVWSLGSYSYPNGEVNHGDVGVVVRVVGGAPGVRFDGLVVECVGRGSLACAEEL